MNALKSSVKSMAKNPFKTSAKDLIISQIKTFSKKHSFSLGSLPSETWDFEKRLLDGGVCPKKIVGFEREIAAFEAAKRNSFYRFSDVSIIRTSNVDKELLKHTDINVWFLDYCGLPAVQNQKNKSRFNYPHINEFARKAKQMIQMKQKGIIYLTFCCASRQVDNGIIQQAMAPNASSFHGAIGIKIRQTLNQFGIANHVHEIFRVHYQGNTIPMLTIGYGINYAVQPIRQEIFPENKTSNVNNVKILKDNHDLFKTFRNLAKKMEVIQKKMAPIQKRLSVIQSIINEDKTLFKTAVKMMVAKGYSNERISASLSVPRSAIGQISAHARHPESFGTDR